MTPSSKISPVSLLFLLLFLCSPLLALRLDPYAYGGGFSKNESEKERRNSSAVAQVLGDVRTNLSDLLYIKTERYLHSGIAYLKKDPQSARHEEHEHEGHEHEAEANHDEHAHEHEDRGTSDSLHHFDFENQLEHAQEEFKKVGRSDEHHDDDAGAPTMIKSQADDFRGFVGYLERQVKPWQPASQAHHHTDGTELLPWYRMMTISDPHNVRAYLIGSWWLKSMGNEQVGEALDFVAEGIKNNPDSYQLYLQRGYLYQAGLQDLSNARKAFLRAAELAVEARPAGGKEDPLRWTHYNEEDACAAVRLAVLTEKQIGSKAEALRLARLYNEKLGGDAILERQIAILSGKQPDVAGEEEHAHEEEHNHDRDHEHSH